MKRLEPKNATDTQLLAHFEQGRDQSAFAEIVRRYGPMVLATAMRRLHSKQDAEDASQATFLALAKAADRFSNGQVLVAWLHKTACRTSSSMRRGLVRRNRLMERLMEQSDARKTDIDTKNANPAEVIANGEALEVLDEEISKLPTNLQAAIVLCHLDGLSQKQAANRLGVTISTVNDRLTKGRHALKMKLIHRGITLTLAGLSTYIASSSNASAAINSSLVADTTAKAVLYAAGGSASDIGVSKIVFNEANQVISTMTTMKIASVFLTALAILILAGPIAAVVGMNGIGSVRAGTFFLDTFDDMNINDDTPFSWSGVDGTILDASSGDLVIAPKVGGAFAVIDNYDYEDVSVRGLVRIEGDEFASVGVGARGTPGVSAVFGFISGNQPNQAEVPPNSLVISKSPNIVLQHAPTTLDPTQMDVWLQLDSFGDELTLTAWADGIPKASISAEETELAGNSVGVSYGYLNASQGAATFRSFETVPEPSGFAMPVLGMLGSVVWFRSRKRRAVRPVINTQLAGSSTRIVKQMLSLLVCAMLVASFAHSSVAQDFVTVSFTKTTESDPFDTSAVWLGSGTTNDGNEVVVRTSGLQVSPGDGFFNVDAFTFEVSSVEMDFLLDMTGTFTPTGDLTGTTGDISLVGTRNSTLVASTMDGLLTVTGDISFNPVPEPSALMLGGFAILSCLMFRRRRFGLNNMGQL